MPTPDGPHGFAPLIAPEGQVPSREGAAKDYAFSTSLSLAALVHLVGLMVVWMVLGFGIQLTIFPHADTPLDLHPVSLETRGHAMAAQRTGQPSTDVRPGASSRRVAQPAPPAHHAPVVAVRPRPASAESGVTSRRPPPRIIDVPPATLPRAASTQDAAGAGTRTAEGGLADDDRGGNGIGLGGDGGGDLPGGGRMLKLVNRVACAGCHNETGYRIEPDEIERLMQQIHWRDGGLPHRLTLAVTLDSDGRVTNATVESGSGRADVDESSIEFVKMTHWRIGRRFYHRHDNEAASSGPWTIGLPLLVYF